MSKVSIIMPVYNAERYLREAIESVRNQSYSNWELLIVNDGSTDHSAEIIDVYSQKDARIKALHKKNEGVSVARNYALAQISGEFVTFIDSDDVYHVYRLARLLQVFERYPDCDIVFSRHEVFTGKLRQNDAICSEKATNIDNNIANKEEPEVKVHESVEDAKKFAYLVYDDADCIVGAFPNREQAEKFANEFAEENNVETTVKRIYRSEIETKD